MSANKVMEKSEIKALHLDNGLAAVLAPNPRLESVCISFAVPYGNAHSYRDYDLPYAHQIEHGLYAGTKRRSMKRIESLLREISTEQGGFTHVDVSVFYMRAPKAYLERSVELLADMTTNSTLAGKSFEIEKSLMTNEYLYMLEPHSDYEFKTKFTQALFRGHPYARHRAFTDVEINTMSETKLLEIYKEQYAPPNPAIALCGAFEESKAHSILEKYFGAFQGKGKRSDLPDLQTGEKGETIVVRDENAVQNHILLGFRRPSLRANTPKEEAAFGLVTTLLDDRLFQNIRQSVGETYRIGVQDETGWSFGTTMLYAYAKPSRYERVRKLLEREIEKVSSGEIGKKEISGIIRRFMVKSPLIREEPALFAKNLSFYQAVALDPLYMLKGYASVKELTEEDVLKAASRYINLDTAVVAELVTTKRS